MTSTTDTTTSTDSTERQKVAFLVAPEGIEQVELTGPWEAVENSGATPVLLSTQEGTVHAYHHLDKGDTFDVDATVASADVVRDRHVTSWPSLQTDLRNAGATWEHREVVVDDNLITSRNPDDIPAFTRELTAALTASVSA